MRRPARGARRRLTVPLLAVLAGMVLLGVAGGVALDESGRTFRADTFRADQAPTPAPEPAMTPPVPAPSAPGTSSARLADLRPRSLDPPVELRLGSTRVPVVPVGLGKGGQVEVPEDVGTAGWYRFGPQPGDARGSAVLVGHVDDRQQGLGVFAELRELAPGAAVEVRRAGGAVLSYVVVAREQWSKEKVPMQQLFATEGAPRLVLITCAGRFDRATGSYSDNVAVLAVPA